MRRRGWAWKWSAAWHTRTRGWAWRSRRRDDSCWRTARRHSMNTGGHGVAPTIYAGVSRGGYAAVYAAQRDPHAVQALNVHGCMVVDLWNKDGDWIHRMRHQSWGTLEAGAQGYDGSRDVWFYGGRDEVCSAESGRTMHDRAGAGARLVVWERYKHDDWNSTGWEDEVRKTIRAGGRGAAGHGPGAGARPVAGRGKCATWHSFRPAGRGRNRHGQGRGNIAWGSLKPARNSTCRLASPFVSGPRGGRPH